MITDEIWLVDWESRTATVRTSEGKAIARCYRGDTDAIAIAALPKLLAACQAVLNEFPALDGKRIESVKAICRAAIAETKGAKP